MTSDFGEPRGAAKAQGPGTGGGGGSGRRDKATAFDRRELDAILRVYGRGVASGQWRDYAIDHLPDRAVFSIFRRSSEAPLYRIEKRPALARAQGAYLITGMDGRILRRGRDLALALRVIQTRLLRLVE